MYVAGIIETIITFPVGIIFIILGLLLLKKQKIQRLIVLGVCTCLTGIIDYLFRTGLGWILFAVGMAVCFTIGNKAQKTYNGSWFC